MVFSYKLDIGFSSQDPRFNRHILYHSGIASLAQLSTTGWFRMRSGGTVTERSAEKLVEKLAEKMVEQMVENWQEN